MKRIRFGRPSLLAALVVVLGACNDSDRLSPVAPEEPGSFAKGGGKPAGGGNPSAQKIAFSALGAADARIYTISPDGTGFTTVSNTEGGTDPAWSPDRKKLAFVIPSGPDAGLYVIGANGKSRARLYSGAAAAPAWSPDGSKIAFQATVGSSQQILVVRQDGSDLQHATGVGHNTSPSWSPDGGRLAFQSVRTETTGIWIMNVETGQLSLLTSCDNCRSPEWSPVPGDERIAFSTYKRVSLQVEYAAINIVNTDGSNLQTLLQSHQHRQHDLRPSWSPDAARLVINSGMLGGRNLVLVDANGANPRKVAELAGDQIAPAWAR